MTTARMLPPTSDTELFWAVEDRGARLMKRLPTWTSCRVPDVCTSTGRAAGQHFRRSLTRPRTHDVRSWRRRTFQLRSTAARQLRIARRVRRRRPEDGRLPRNLHQRRYRGPDSGTGHGAAAVPAL
jgi:hypothetical protein